jgi:hypothetical protein
MVPAFVFCGSPVVSLTCTKSFHIGGGVVFKEPVFKQNLVIKVNTV